VNQRSTLALGALAGAAGAVLFGRRRQGPASAPSTVADPRADELRQKLAEARRADVDETEFQAAGMGAETIVADEPKQPEGSPADEFEAMRRRVHEDARAAADEMRRRAEAPDAP